MNVEMSLAVPTNFSSSVVVGVRCSSAPCSDGAVITLHICAPPLSMHHVTSCDQCGKAPHGAGSWCADPERIAFSWDVAHVEGPDVKTIGCSALGGRPQMYNLNGGGKIYAATNAYVGRRQVVMSVKTPGETSKMTFPLLEDELAISASPHYVGPPHD